MIFAVQTYQLLNAEEQLQKQFRGPFEPKIFEQVVDHFRFGPLRYETFKQRYYVNENFINDSTNNKTAILYICGESDCKKAPGGDRTSYDILGQIAQERGARIFAMEHRMYGETQPFRFENGSADLDVESLKFLSARQQIADLIHFATSMDKQYCAKQAIPGRPCLTWMLAGGSYSGAVAGWLMQQHPHFFAAAIGSSGVVKSIYNATNFDLHTTAAAGAPCQSAMLIAMREIESDVEKFKVAFNATGSVDADFFYFLADTSLMVFQYGNWGNFCPDLINAYRENWGNITDIFVKYIASNYDYLHYDRNNLTVNYKGHFRQWWYQTCTEVAYYQPAPLKNNMRSKLVTIDWHLEICDYVFGLKLGDPTDRMNQYFGGLDTIAPNTYFTNFWQDIWHLCGKLNNNEPNVDFIGCRDCGHCIDLHVFNENDPQELLLLRQREYDFIIRWLNTWDMRE